MSEYGIYFLVTVYTLFESVSLQCFDSSYQRRYAFDNYIFGDTTLFDDTVDSRADCVSKCQWDTLCNQAIYHDGTKMCKLYADSRTSLSGGTVGSGWQYYGASCDIYHPNNSDISKHVLVDDADNICDNNYHALITCSPTACFSGGTWTSFAVRCTQTLFSISPPLLNPAMASTITVPFDLASGHVISIRMKGSSTQENQVNLVDNNGDYPFHYAVRFHYAFPQCAFNTKESGTFGAEQTKFYLMDYIDTADNYKVDIHIMDSEFKIYGDGHLLLTSAMRLSFTGVRKLEFKGIEQLKYVKIGLDTCLN